MFNFINNISKNKSFKLIIANLNWLFFEKFFQMVVAFFVGVWVVKYLGPENYGILSYVIAFVSLLAIVSKFGIDNIAIREFVEKKEHMNKIFGTLFFLKILTGVLSFILASIIINFIKPDNANIIYMVMLMSISFIFNISDVFDFWFRSNLKSKNSVLIRTFTNIIIALLRVMLIIYEASLFYFALTYLIESVIILIGFTFIFLKEVKYKKAIYLDLDPSLFRKIISNSWPLALSSIAIFTYMRIDQLIIGNMLGAKELGIYSVAVNLSEVWYFVPMIISSAVFPVIVSMRLKDRNKYFNRLQTFYDFMFWISIAIILPITIFSREIIMFIYGPEYISATPIVSIYLWAGVAVFIGVASEQYLLAENLTRVSLLRSLIGCLFNVILNIYLIPIYGLVGSAWSTLISYFISSLAIALNKEARFNIMMFVKTLNLFRIFKEIKVALYINR